VRAPRVSPAFPPGGQWRYLVEWKPLHVAGSASVYAELKRWRRSAEVLPSPLVAFGDPVIRQGPAILRTRGFPLEPLPASRREVQSIARVYGDRATALLGPAATEEKAKSVEKDVRYLHFATHVVLDDRLPLNSAIVLSMPDPPGEGRDNGLLESWEVFESLRLDADLVVLSGCESGLGQHLEGEGLLGLTQAFHYAGARSILASLWPAADESTADLMARFYAHLKRGASKDQALRSAQLEMLSRGRASAPYYWALFQLRGDWR
jgi:CHAT domain-containing protein